MTRFITFAAIVVFAGCGGVVSEGEDLTDAVSGHGAAQSPNAIQVFDKDGVSYLSVTGAGFGSPSSTARLRLKTSGTQSDVFSTDARIVRWSDEHIVVRLGKDQVGHAQVLAPRGPARRGSEVEGFDLDYFFTASDQPKGGPLPTAIAADANGRVWINFEFHTNMAVYEPTVNRVNWLQDYPTPPVPIFETCALGACGPNKIASYGEAVKIDSRGRAWFTEGGTEFAGPKPNHSRILSVDPNSYEIGLYNLPGNRNVVVGVDWDEQRHRIWFGQTASAGEPAKLISFNPERIPHRDYGFAWVPNGHCQKSASATFGVCQNASYHHCETDDDCVLAEQICPPNVVDDGSCYHEYPLTQTNVYEPGHVAVHPDGAVWVSSYFLGTSLERLEPESGKISSFSLSFPPTGLYGSWPYQLVAAPNGDIVAAEFFGGKIARVPQNRFHDRCDQLISTKPGVSCVLDPVRLFIDPSCQNPCVAESQIPGLWQKAPDGKLSPRGNVAFVAVDQQNRAWFNQGYLQRGKFTLLPPLLSLYRSRFCTVDDSGSGMGAGIAIDGKGAIWGADFCGRRLIRLTPR